MDATRPSSKRCPSCGACQECGAVPAPRPPIPYPASPYPHRPPAYPNPWVYPVKPTITYEMGPREFIH